MNVLTSACLAAAAGLLGLSVATATPRSSVNAAASPTPSCQPTSAASTPGPVAHGAMGDMDMKSDMTEMPLEMMYIDMMIPHHASVIALAEAALPDLQDARLQEMAEAIIATQGDEITALQDLRETLYDQREPMPMDEGMVTAMAEMMPDMGGDKAAMAFQMDTAAQVAAICAAEDVDAAFMAQIIPHHQMAIDASRALLASSDDATLRAIADKVIAAQQAEIDLLHELQPGAEAAATPAA